LAPAGLPRVVLVIVGDRAEDFSRLRALAIGLSVAERVVLIGKALNIAVPEYLWAADVLVMPYTSRTPTVRYISPLKMSEYMAAGRPIVDTDVPVVREIVRDGDTALLVKADSGEALRESVAAILGNAGLARKMSLTLLDQAKSYSWKARARRILALTMGQGVGPA